ncbi:uncharacterized protein L201_006616 [Kwoniella dendrophila CBS 6074]|uniref:SAP domain-containing protein n=1 Tax=Kwoniella dendrophila CBS 6074 TaxID=1295534 RepID=A0AAX4K4J0_9TREE
MEAKLQKLKVTELKELLAKHHLVQTGKKDDLIKRLLDNNVGLDDEPAEELVDPDVTAPVPSVPQTSSTPAVSATAPATTTETSAPAPNTTENAPAETSVKADELTPEQKAMKARAERFGVPFNPNPTPKTKPNSTTKNGSKEQSSVKPPNTTTPSSTNGGTQKKEKAGSIDTASLGISQEVLDKRAAKFGLPEKKESNSAPAPTSKATSAAPASKKVENKKQEEITPEMAEKIAIEEEKKRKRAEKFGITKPANGTEPDTKKVKV